MARQKKQEEKRLRRQAKHLNPSGEGEVPEDGQEPGQEAEAGADTPGTEPSGDETPGEGTPEAD